MTVNHIEPGPGSNPLTGFSFCREIMERIRNDYTLDVIGLLLILLGILIGTLHSK